jgi:hypothetical protein
VPGFNGTRTPGRNMAVVVVLYAILLGYFVSQVIDWFKQKKWEFGSIIFVAVCLVLIVSDFNYVRPGINTFMQSNKAYESIGRKQARVIALPFQQNSDHYLNATFLPLALKYDLRMFAGHSSMYPKALDEQVNALYSINDGEISEPQWKWLLENEYEYIISHYTKYNPRVSRGAILGLSVNRYVDFVMQDDGVYLYKIRKMPKNSLDIGEAEMVDLFEKLPEIAGTDLQNGIEFLSGWYGRELYAGQRPFRWMHKTSSSLIVPFKRQEQSARIRFDYLCPSGTLLKVSTKLANSIPQVKHLPDGWEQMEIELSFLQKKGVIVNFKASQESRFPPDTRDFGCQVGDIVVEQP